jgi:hypothetical protein
MTIQAKADKLTEFIRHMSGWRIVTSPDGNYDHLGATIADAVLQANMRYETHVRPRITRIRKMFPAAATMSGLKTTLTERTSVDFLDTRGLDRAERFESIVALFSSEDIETEDDLRTWLMHEKNIAKLANIKGIGPKTLDYFKILTSIQTCAIDRRLLDFLKLADIEVSNYDEAKSVVNLAADLMGVGRVVFDYSIWEYIGRERPTHAAKRTPNKALERIGKKR